MSVGPDGRQGSEDDIYIRRSGREIESKLQWVDDPKELAEKQAVVARKRLEKKARQEGGGQDRPSSQELEQDENWDIEATLQEFRSSQSTGFIRSDQDGGTGEK